MFRACCLLAALVLAIAACDAPAPNAELVARVNGQGIPKAQYEAEVRSQLARYRSRGQAFRPASEQRVKESVMRRMIDDAVIAQKAKMLAVTLNDVELEVHLQEHRKRFPTEDAYQDYLKRSSNTPESLKEELRRNLLRERILDRMVGAIEVSEDEIARYYGANKARFAQARPALSLEEAKDAIRSTLLEQKQGEKRREALRYLKDSARVEQLFVL